MTRAKRRKLQKQQKQQRNGRRQPRSGSASATATRRPVVRRSAAKLEKGAGIRPRPLFNRNFLLLWQGLAVSQLGSQIYAIAITFWIKEATGSATLMGLLMMTSSVPGILLSVVSGALSDRYSRRSIIMFADLTRGILTLSLAALLFIAPENTSLIIAWMFVVGVGNAMSGSLFGPAVSAAIPDLVHDSKVAHANSLRQMTLQVIQFVGRGLAGLAFRLLGAPVLALCNGISFLISVACMFFVNMPEKIEADTTATKPRLTTEIMEGFRYVRKVPGLTEVFIISSLLGFLTMPIIVLLPFYVEDLLHVSLDWYGYVLAIYGAGAFLGSMTAGVVKLSARWRAPVVLIVANTYCVCVALLGLVTNLAGALTLALLIGGLGAFNGVTFTTLLQLRTPPRMRGRVFGLLATLSGSLAPLGMGLGGLAFDLLGKNISLIYVSCGSLMTFLCLLICMNKGFRSFLQSDAQVTGLGAGEQRP